VHFAIMHATDIAILKPLIRDRLTELPNKDGSGLTPLDWAKRNPVSAVGSFMTEVDAAYRNGDYPALIKLCGSTPAREKAAFR